MASQLLLQFSSRKWLLMFAILSLLLFFLYFVGFVNPGGSTSRIYSSIYCFMLLLEFIDCRRVKDSCSTKLSM